MAWANRSTTRFWSKAGLESVWTWSCRDPQIAVLMARTAITVRTATAAAADIRLTVFFRLATVRFMQKFRVENAGRDTGKSCCSRDFDDPKLPLQRCAEHQGGVHTRTVANAAPLHRHRPNAAPKCTPKSAIPGNLAIPSRMFWRNAFCQPIVFCRQKRLRAEMYAFTESMRI